MLYRVVYQYRQELEYCWEERFQSEYGCLRDERNLPALTYLMAGKFDLSNAVIYSHPGGVVQVGCLVDQRAKQAVFSVSDDGIGIHEKKIPKPQ